MTLRVFLCGEGRNELGDWANSAPYRPAPGPPPRDPAAAGVLVALLRKARGDGWEVHGACLWKAIRKFRVGVGDPEARNVQGLLQDAHERGCEVVAFLRDADGEESRVEAIRAGLDQAHGSYPGLRVIGGTPSPVLEAWILSFLGVTGAHRLRKTGAQRRLKEKGIPSKDTARMVQAIEKAERANLPADAQDLRDWLLCADEALSPVDEPTPKASARGGHPTGRRRSRAKAPR